MVRRQAGRGWWRPEYTVAMIGLAGVVLTNVATNWDRLFGDAITIEPVGYAETDDIDTEIRLLLDRTGERRAYEDAMATTEQTLREIMRNSVPEAEIARVAPLVAASMPEFDDYVAQVLPIYRKHYTLAELQRLNRIYASPELREERRRQLEVARETNEIFRRMVVAGQQAAMAQIAAGKPR